MLVASFEVWSSSVMTAHCDAWDAYSTASRPAATTIASTGSVEIGGARSRRRTPRIFPARGSRPRARRPISRDSVRFVAAACASAFAALLLAGSAGAIGAFGVTEDAGKYSRDGGGPFFAQLADLGMNENAITIYWDPTLPGGMAEPGLLDSTLPYAAAAGVRVVLTVYAAHPAQFTQSPTAEAQFAAFLERLPLAYPEVKDFVVGNEPNQPRFWQPQFAPDGTEA